MTGDLEHRQFALQLAERRSWSRHPNRRTRRLPTAAAERPAEPFYTRSSGAASDDNRTASAGHSKQLHACSQRQDAWSVRLVHGYRNRHRRRYPGHRAADRVAAGSASRVTAGSGICCGCYAVPKRGAGCGFRRELGHAVGRSPMLLLRRFTLKPRHSICRK